MRDREESVFWLLPSPKDISEENNSSHSTNSVPALEVRHHCITGSGKGGLLFVQPAKGAVPVACKCILQDSCPA